MVPGKAAVPLERDTGGRLFAGADAAGKIEVVIIRKYHKVWRAKRIRSHHMQEALLGLVRHCRRDLIDFAGDRIGRRQRAHVTFKLARDWISLPRVSIDVESRRRIRMHGEWRRIVELSRQEAAQIGVDLAD